MNPREKAVFEAKQIMRLGSEDPVCVWCGESNPLRLVLPNGHHVTGSGLALGTGLGAALSALGKAAADKINKKQEATGAGFDPHVSAAPGDKSKTAAELPPV